MELIKRGIKMMTKANDNKPNWFFNEFKSVGVDYSNVETADEYDARHQEFRDYEKEAQIVIERLGLTEDVEIIDLGCGTGAFAIQAAGCCKSVHAVDISKAMLDQCKKKADQRELKNINFHNAGLLTYEHSGEPVDAITSKAVLHHLPDFWKQIALNRIYDMLKPGGKFYLFDVVFSFPAENYINELNAWIEGMRDAAGDELADETEIHVRDEFSTFDWVMDSLLEKAGFIIIQKYTDFPNCYAYVCERPLHADAPKNLGAQYDYWNEAAKTKTFTNPLNIGWIESCLAKDALLLDIGCGYGRLTSELYAQGYINTVGLDFSEKMIEKGKQLHPQCDLRIWKDEALPFPDGSVDAVILFAVLTCIPEDFKQNKLIKEIKRVLKFDGVLYLSDYYLQTDERNLDRYRSFENKYGLYGIFETSDGAVVRHFSKDRIAALITDFKLLQKAAMEVETMNGNRADIFQMLLKPE